MINKKLFFNILFSPVSFFMTMSVNGQEPDQPDIILIIADDHGTDALGCYANPVIKTPALDALANDGIQFTNAFCTSPSSSPSRSVILTGIHNHANGMYGLEHDFHHFSALDEIKSLPEFLSKCGYQTVQIGKFHIDPEKVFKFDLVLSEGDANDNNALRGLSWFNKYLCANQRRTMRLDKNCLI